jgi:transcription elongation factor Elf1
MSPHSIYPSLTTQSPTDSPRQPKLEISFLLGPPSAPSSIPPPPPLPFVFSPTSSSDYSHSIGSPIHSHTSRMLSVLPPPPPPRNSRQLPDLSSTPAPSTSHHHDQTLSLQESSLQFPRAQKLGKRFKCPACDKTFSEHGNSNKHYRAVHLQSKPFNCATCDASFAFADGLRRHQMRHMNVRPWECRECGYRFKQKSHLSRCVYMAFCRLIRCLY